MNEGIPGDQKPALLSFGANIALFVLKASVALTSGSFALLSSAFDSLNDIFSYGIGAYMIRESGKGPDFDHPFGHRRMEPVAGLVMAVFAGILSFEILRSVATGLLFGREDPEVGLLAIGVLTLTVIVKISMFLMLKRESEKSRSPALEAMSIDSRNDILSNSVAVLGVAGAYSGFPLLDDLAAIFIGLYIARSAYAIARKNYDFVVGARPPQEIFEAIERSALVDGVVRVGSIRAHYVGDQVHAEVAIVLSKGLDGPRSHDIAVRVQGAVESIEPVSRAFIHVDFE